MLRDILSALRCPYCDAHLDQRRRALVCSSNHSFDLSRQGYASLLPKHSALTGDTSEMVAARAAFLEAGHFAPLARALDGLVDDIDLEKNGSWPGLIVELGGGTGYYIASVLERHPARFGVTIDLSKHATRRAAKAHPRLSAFVGDARQRLPLMENCAALALNIFAPRPGPELHRILAKDGSLIVVVPEPTHLESLRGPLGLLSIDPEKESRVATALGPGFERIDSRAFSWTMTLTRGEGALLAQMGPSGHHLTPERLQERLKTLPEAIAVEGIVRLDLYRAV